MADEQVVVERKDITLLTALIGIALLSLAITVALAVGAIVVVLGQNKQLHRDASVALQTHQGVCVYRQTLEAQVRQTDEFLASHPNGIPGISAATLRRGEATQRAAISALSNINCS